MQKLFVLVGIFLCVSALTGTAHGLLAFGSCRTLPVISGFSLSQYSGKWYEVQRFTPSYLIGTSCVVANYGFINSSAISVKNQATYLSLNLTRTGIATAIVPDSSKPNQLVVYLERRVLGVDLQPTTGDYNVLITDYTTYSVVYSCDAIIPGLLRRDTVWIFSRTKTLSQDTINNIYTYLTAQGFDVSKFDKPSQACNN